MVHMFTMQNQTHGIVIMEHFKEVTRHDLQLDETYVALAHLLQKIHHGQVFKSCGYDVFKRIARDLNAGTPKYGKQIPLTKLEQVITVIYQALEPLLIATVPCHNDLHVGNLMFLGNELRAIDYEDASPGDPYYDVATVTASVQFNCKPTDEKLLLATYLDRQPTDKEIAKLYLFKIVAWIKWACDALNSLTPETVSQYESIKTPLLADIARKHLEGNIDSSKPENSLKTLKAMLNYVFDNFESQEFRDAINRLKK